MTSSVLPAAAGAVAQPAPADWAGHRRATSGAAALLSGVATLPGVELAELVERAALQTRVDRKYLVGAADLTGVLDALAASAAVLDIDGRRQHGYSSVYFDTGDLLCFREHRQGRRRRFKVRTRRYVDSGQCLLEVKAVGPRGQTIKHRMDYPAAAAGRLTGEARPFVACALAGHPAVDELLPSLTIDYRRATLLDRAADSRITIDTGLRFRAPQRAWVEAPGQVVVVETKSAGRPGTADLTLRRLGVRPMSVSKYCVGIAMVHPDVPANRWHATLRRHFGARAHWAP